jgi:5-methylcytosine-specific restriction endonuclease McrA
VSSTVTIRLRQEDAEKGARGDAGALRRVRAALGLALDQLRRRGERKVARVQALQLPGGRKERPKGWPTPKLRRTVWERSEGRCENPYCRRRITWGAFDLDHFRGRARAPQLPENTWALCSDKDEPGVGCHQMKHAAKPSRQHWLNTFLLHLKAHGFGESETARKVLAELEGEELIERAQEIRARQDAAAGVNHG